ncbi:hypothetical protein WJX73_000273 [Symbiochloris irregularis]|uniref:Uncharacterized protein n=1 Tax=Symbiochloris irregularis TaxID=706552 RepID=A0AAW1NKZ4_9CHLO
MTGVDFGEVTQSVVVTASTCAAQNFEEGCAAGELEAAMIRKRTCNRLVPDLLHKQLLLVLQRRQASSVCSDCRRSLRDEWGFHDESKDSKDATEDAAQVALPLTLPTGA